MSHPDTANWNLPPPLGFLGLRDHVPLTVYEELLPHWRQAGATYFVTFRLNDSLPQSKLHELRQFKAEWERRHPPPRSSTLRDEVAREMFRRIEGWLDQGHGSCILWDSKLAERVVQALHTHDGKDYELGCYVVMANHVHAIVRPLVPSENDVEDILKIWKGRSAYEINRQRGANGTLWQRESSDRIICGVSSSILAGTPGMRGPLPQHAPSGFAPAGSNAAGVSPRTSRSVGFSPRLPTFVG